MYNRRLRRGGAGEMFVISPSKYPKNFFQNEDMSEIQKGLNGKYTY